MKWKLTGALWVAFCMMLITSVQTEKNETKNLTDEQLKDLKESSLKAKTIKDFNLLAYGYLNPSNPLFSKAIILNNLGLAFL